MFESHQNHPRDESRKWRILLASFLFMIAGFLAYAIVEGSTEPPRTWNGETAAERVENLCSSLPTPENFKRGYRQPVDHYFCRVAFDQLFYSDYRTIEEVLPTYIWWFNENGWRQSFFTDQNGETRLEFRKNNQSITLRSERYVTGYTVTCAESEVD
jgi:hypothetical protein